MRKKNLIKGDIVFQWKYGFYVLYMLVFLVYLIIFSFFQGEIKNTIVACCVYSDPAAMGMFFMGALILLEKNQHITNSIIVSPVTPGEYVASKVIAFAFISEIVGLLLIMQGHTKNLFLCMLGILFGSILFSLCGVIVGTKVENLNQYIVGTIPFEMVGFAPVITYRIGYGWDNPIALFHPGCAAMRLIEGESNMSLLSIFSLLVWCVLIYLLAIRCVRKMYQCLGGIKL